MSNGDKLNLSEEQIKETRQAITILAKIFGQPTAAQIFDESGLEIDSFITNWNKVEAEALEREMWGIEQPTFEKLKKKLDAALERNYLLNQSNSTLKWENDKLKSELEDSRRR